MTSFSPVLLPRASLQPLFFCFFFFVMGGGGAVQVKPIKSMDNLKRLRYFFFFFVIFPERYLFSDSFFFFCCCFVFGLWDRYTGVGHCFGSALVLRKPVFIGYYFFLFFFPLFNVIVDVPGPRRFKSPRGWPPTCSSAVRAAHDNRRPVR